MDLAYLKKIVRIVENSTIDEIVIEEEGLKVKVARNNPLSPQQPVQSVAMQQAASSKVEPLSASQVPPAKAEIKYHEIKSPIVGTFYRAPAPDADSYVEIGAVVQPKQVLCIIEAMKLMNEIECDISGRIVKILVENAKPVEYNQVLFLIESI